MATCTPEPQYLTIQQAAEMLSVCTQTLRRWDRAGKLRSVRHPITGHRFYRREDLEPFRLGSAPHGSTPIPPQTAVSDAGTPDSGASNPSAPLFFQPPWRDVQPAPLLDLQAPGWNYPGLDSGAFFSEVDQLRSRIHEDAKRVYGVEDAGVGESVAGILGTDGHVWRRGSAFGPELERDLQLWEIEPVVKAMIVATQAATFTADRGLQSRTLAATESFNAMVRGWRVRAGSDDPMPPGGLREWSGHATCRPLESAMWIHADLLKTEVNRLSSREFLRLLAVVLHQSLRSTRLYGEPQDVGPTVRLLELMSQNLHKIGQFAGGTPEQFDGMKSMVQEELESREWGMIRNSE